MPELKASTKAVNWAKAKKRFVTTEISKVELAKSLGIQLGVLMRHIREERIKRKVDWNELRAAHHSMVTGGDVLKVSTGRESEYDKTYDEKARKLMRLGATEYEVAEFFGVTDTTLRRWAFEHENFCCALKVGDDQADERVVSSLFAKATGYSRTIKRQVVHEKSGKVIDVEHIVHVPPSESAAQFWLKNRRSHVWKDKQPTDEVPPPQLHVTMTAKEFRNIAKKVAQDV